MIVLNPMPLSSSAPAGEAMFRDLNSDVFVAQAPSARYSRLPDKPFPELPDTTPTTALAAVRGVFEGAGLDAPRFGGNDWNPLGRLVPAGSRVLLKPNWVRHPVPGRDDGESLVTHAHVIEAVLAYLTKVPGCHVTIGDAPIQGCHFDTLLAASGIPEMVARCTGRLAKLEVVDFRKTVLGREDQDGRVRRDCRSDDHFVLCDLGRDSLLEAVTTSEPRFRVTVYNPDHLARTHVPGRHQYLVAREVLDAEVVFNLPKLKTHKKAGLTGALKNMVGINGHKEYLPHHRLGGTADGGDCYPGRNRLKALAERLLDAGNRTENRRKMKLAAIAAELACRFNRLLGGDDNLEGSWYGNDTVWRTCLDLQRILHYGKTDGSLAAVPQRRVLTLTDAIVAGQGEGPLRPTPCPMGLVTFGYSTAAVEYVHAVLMGLDPARIPLVRAALQPGKWPLIAGGEDGIRVGWCGQWLAPREAGRQLGTRVTPPAHWQGHCELEG